MKVKLLPGSVITAQATNAAERTSSASGVIRGSGPNPIILGGDIPVTLRTARITLQAPTGGALCAGTSGFPRKFGFARNGRLRLRASGKATMVLFPSVPPAALAGCDSGAGPASGAGIVLRGRLGKGGLTHLVLGGGVPRVALPGGLIAELKIGLTLNVDFTGKS